MARTIDQITKEIRGIFDPSISALKKQQAGLAGALKGDEQRLRGEQTNAFKDIELGAKRRGLRFSGIPLAEQAEFTSDRFLPALTDLRRRTSDQRDSLGLAISDILSQRGLLAQQLRTSDLDRELQERLQREAEARADARASRAASAQTSFIPSLLDSLSGGQGTENTPAPDLTSAQELDEARSFATEFAQRLQNSLGDNTTGIRRIFDGLSQRAARDNDILAREKAIAINRLFNFVDSTPQAGSGVRLTPSDNIVRGRGGGGRSIF